MTAVIHVLCAGAAQGLVKSLAPSFALKCGADIRGRFGAVGAMRESLLAGEPCDVMIVTDAMITALAESGDLDGSTRASLGRVLTGIAIRASDPEIDVAHEDSLRASILASDALYFPDPERATAGIHFARVIKSLGIHDVMASRFRTFPNGATAMRELAASTDRHPLGCTQVTEINYTAGVKLVGALPAAFELATVYTAAVSARAADPALARKLVALLSGPESLALRRSGGFVVAREP